MYNECDQRSRKKFKRGFMTKIFLLCFLLLCIGTASAQEDFDIPFFDDTPILGRTAPPLDSVRLTPPPAPDIRIDLDNSRDQPTQPTPPPSQPLPSIPSTHIDLSGTSPAPVTVVSSSPSTPPVPLHDVSSFDISDFSLGLPAKEIFQKAKQKGYRVTITQESVPLHYATDYDYACRQKGLVIPDQIKQCVKDLACHQKTRYISEATLTRKNEVIRLYFTSNATDNLLYKILYMNKGDNSLNFTRRNLAKKVRRRDAFWNMMYETYGYPDDKELLIWGDPQKAYMQARMQGSNYNAYIVLEDKEIPDGDYQDADEQKGDLHYRHTFTFGTPSDED